MVSRHSPTSTLPSSLFDSQTFPIFSFVSSLHYLQPDGRGLYDRPIGRRAPERFSASKYVRTYVRSRLYKGHVRTVNPDGDNFIIVCHRSIARSVKHSVPIALARAHCDNLAVDRPRYFAISTRVNSAIRAPMETFISVESILSSENKPDYAQCASVLSR